LYKAKKKILQEFPESKGYPAPRKDADSPTGLVFPHQPASVKIQQLLPKLSAPEPIKESSLCLGPEENNTCTVEQSSGYFLLDDDQKIN